MENKSTQMESITLIEAAFYPESCRKFINSVYGLVESPSARTRDLVNFIKSAYASEKTQRILDIDESISLWSGCCSNLSFTKKGILISDYLSTRPFTDGRYIWWGSAGHYMQWFEKRDMADWDLEKFKRKVNKKIDGRLEEILGRRPVRVFLKRLWEEHDLEIAGWGSGLFVSALMGGMSLLAGLYSLSHTPENLNSRFPTSSQEYVAVSPEQMNAYKEVMNEEIQRKFLIYPQDQSE